MVLFLTSFRALQSIVCTCLLAGCATGSVFVPYPEQAQPVRQALAQEPVVEFAQSSGPDDLLYQLEDGRVLQLVDQYKNSQSRFEAAEKIYREKDNQALIDVSDSASQAASLAVNDNLLVYPDYGYERVLLHLYQALNYLGQNDLTGMQVELRKAAEYQKYIEDTYPEKVSDAVERAKKYNIDLDQLNQSENLLGFDRVSVSNSYQNAFVYYLSAILWEALGNSNDALVDYRKALAIAPANEWLQKDYQRLDAGYWSADETHGKLVVVYEDGLVEPRSDTFLDIWLYPDKILPINFPYYSGILKWQPTQLTVSGEQEVLGSPQAIADIRGLAVSALKENYASILIREILRGRTKYELLKNTGSNDNPLVFIAAQVYTLATAGADLRSWLTLPDNIQMMSKRLNTGVQQVRISSGSFNRQIELNIQPGQTHILRVIRTYGVLDYQHFVIDRQ